MSDAPSHSSGQYSESVFDVKDGWPELRDESSRGDGGVEGEVGPSGDSASFDLLAEVFE